MKTKIGSFQILDAETLSLDITIAPADGGAGEMAVLRDGTRMTRTGAESCGWGYIREMERG